MPDTARRDLMDRLIDYEAGQLETEEEFISLFQELVDTGIAWKLQGHYGRTAVELIENGVINA